jgi:hypothetical protein
MSTLPRRCRRLAVLGAVVAAVVPAAGAQAKGLTGLTVCGTNGCVDRTALVTHDGALLEDLLQGDATVADPGPARFVRFAEHMGDGGEEFGTAKVGYLPDLGIQRFEDGTFHRVSADGRRALARVVAGVTPWAAPKPNVAQAAAPVAAAASPAAGDGDGDGGIGPGAVAGIVAAVAAAGVALLVMMSRRMRRGPAPG